MWYMIPSGAREDKSMVWNSNACIVAILSIIKLLRPTSQISGQSQTTGSANPMILKFRPARGVDKKKVART